MSNSYTGVGSRETPDDILILMRRIGYIMYEISWEKVNEQEKDKESNSQLCGEVHGGSTKARSTRRKKETPKVAKG